jgi:type I restriction-modification system DNA methylase subunit
MQNLTVSNHVAEIVWNFVNRNRAIAEHDELFLATLGVLYGYHKQWLSRDILLSYDSIHDFAKDDISLQLQMYMYTVQKRNPRSLTEFFDRLSSIGYCEFEKEYSSTLVSLYARHAIVIGKYSGEFITPDEINSLIAYYVNKEDCKSVYDPFCGVASILPKLKCAFTGQEQSKRTALLAEILIDACGRDGDQLFVGDSIVEWQNTCVDAVVSCPPFGKRVPREYLICESDASTFPYEIMLKRAFEINNAKLAIVLEAHGVCFRGGSEKQLRSYLVNSNLLDTVISLPTNILYGTSIPCVLLVCKKNRAENEPITFVSADQYFVINDERKRLLDVKRLLEVLENEDSEDIVKATKDEIINVDYNLSPSLYRKEPCDINAGQQSIPLKDLLIPVRGNAIRRNVGTIKNLIPTEYLSSECIDVILNSDKTIDIQNDREKLYREYIPEDDATYILFTRMNANNSKFRIAIHSSKDSFTCTQVISVFKVNTGFVMPEYLAVTLLNLRFLQYGSMQIERYMEYSIVIDSLKKQKEIVAKLKQEFAEQKQKEHEADKQRLGIKQNVSDLEHLLGTPQFKINQIIARLERMTPDASNYAVTVKSLRDNMEYMNRLIRFNNAKIDPSLFNMREGNIVEFLNGYADGWRNYGGNYFELLITNNAPTDSIVSFDKNMLTVMLDAILSNAIRHGFMKDKTYTEHNCVDIDLSTVVYMGKPYVQMRVANNGEPMQDGFSIKDYISRGRFSAQTGRSGLGGYHVYQVVKGHNGFLYLDSNNVWNMVVEILLPLEGVISSDDLTEYEHGEACI